MSDLQRWQDSWLMETAERLEMQGAWRGILTEYFHASLKLVDNSEELSVLEELLADRTPTLHASREDQHPQLLAPFNFRPQHSSRFRAAKQSGFWYGASTLEASMSEVAYWRMVFVRDSIGLAKQELLTDHSFFQANVLGIGIDLMATPWSEQRNVWRHPTDYSETQALAAAAEKANVQWIRYESVRAPNSPLAVVFTPTALNGSTQEVNATLQEWTCKANLDRVVLVNKQSGVNVAWTIDGD